MELVKTDLQISKIGVHDGGMYRCEIEQDEIRPLAVVHTVEILGEETRYGWKMRRNNTNPFPMITLIRIISANYKHHFLNCLKDFESNV